MQVVQRVRQAVFGLALSFLLVPVVASAQWEEGGPTNSNLPAGSLSDIIQNLMQWLLYVVGFLAVVGFVISGILYLTSAGDDDKIETAKNAMIYSIIGVIVAILGLVIIQAASGLLTGGNDRI